MSQRGRLTIREVAEAAGVSAQTVSRVMNNRPDVAPDTYDRIQRIIAEIGYSPNMLARGLTQGRSHVLGVVAFGLDYFGPSRVLTGIDQQAAELGYAISLNLIHRPETDDVQEILSGLFARQVDGVIWAIPQVGGNLDWSHHRAQHLPVPVVLVGGMAGETSLPSIGIDNRAIGRLATAAPAGWRRPEHRPHHRATELVGGARTRGGLARDDGLERLWRHRRAQVRGRLDGGQRRGGSASPACCLPGHGRRVRQQRPDGPGRAPRRPHPGSPCSRRPVRGRRRQHARGFPLLAALDDGPPAPWRCRPAGRRRRRRRHPAALFPPQLPERDGAADDPVAAKGHRAREQPARDLTRGGSTADGSTRGRLWRRTRRGGQPLPAAPLPGLPGLSDQRLGGGGR